MMAGMMIDPRSMSREAWLTLWDDANDYDRSNAMADRLARFAEWTCTTVFPVDRVTVQEDGESYFSDEFLVFCDQNGLSLDWVYLGDAMPLVMRAFNEAQKELAA